MMIQNRVSVLTRNGSRCTHAIAPNLQDTTWLAGSLGMQTEPPVQSTYGVYVFTYSDDGVPEKYHKEERGYGGHMSAQQRRLYRKRRKNNADHGKTPQTTCPLKQHHVDFTYTGKNITRMSMTIDGMPDVTRTFDLTSGNNKNPLGTGALRLQYACSPIFSLDAFSEKRDHPHESNLRLQPADG